MASESQSLIVVLPEKGEEASQAEALEARKALETIDIRVMNRPITLLQHKIYNVWIAFAQSTIDGETRIYEFPLNEVMEQCGFDSNNTEYFVDSAKQLFDLRVEYNSLGRQVELIEVNSRDKPKAKRATRAPVRWAAAQLISFIEIDSSKNLMRVEFPEVIRQEILRPDQYRSIDLQIQAQFASRAGLALYEYVLRYAPEGSSPWMPWETYSMLLSGSAEPHKTTREFSKLLKRAIEQVNTHHESHQIHAEFTKRGRAFHRLRIVIKLRHQSHLPFQTASSLPKAVLDSLKKLGLREHEIETIAQSHPLDYIQAQLSYVQRRLSDSTRGPVKVPGAYLRTALLGNYAQHRPNLPKDEPKALPVPASRRTSEPIQLQTTPPTSLKDAEVSVGTSLPATPEYTADLARLAQRPRSQPDELATTPRRGGRLEDVRQWYGLLEGPRKAELAKTFYGSVSITIRKMIEKSGMESKTASTAFYTWLREEGHYAE